MARCRCAEETCICVLRAGDGTQLTGTGAPTSPWVISAPPRAANAVAVIDTPSLDLTRAGAGTVVDPYLISGQARIDPLIDFVDTTEVNFTTTGAGTEASPMQVTADLPTIETSGGAQGNVLTQGADGVFRPGPAAQVGPGFITVGPGLTGDGSILNPLRVNVCTYAQLKALCAS